MYIYTALRKDRRQMVTVAAITHDMSLHSHSCCCYIVIVAVCT